MSKKTLTILLSVMTLLIAAIVLGISMLYSGTDKKSGKDAVRFREAHPLIAAIPSDAALVYCAKDFATAADCLTDSAAVFGQLLSGKLNGLFRSGYPSLRRASAILSLHYSKDFTPLLVIGMRNPSDTTEDVRRLLAAADSNGLHAKVQDGDILISSSETILNSALRHLSGGMSVLNADGFAELASRMDGTDVLFVSHAYADILIRSFCQPRLFKYAPFFERLAKWSAFNITGRSASGVSMEGTLLDDADPGYYLNLLRQAGSAPVTVPEVLPAHVDFVVSLPIKDIESYLEAYRRHLDARSGLDKYLATLDAQKKSETGASAEDWARQLGVREVAVADLYVGDALHRILLLKPANAGKAAEGVRTYSWKNYAKTVFGGIFTAEAEDACTWIGGWLVTGARNVVEACAKEDFLHETLKDCLTHAGLQSRMPARNAGCFLYYAPGEDPTTLDKTFAPELSKAFRKTLTGVTFVPATLSVSFEDGATVLSFRYDRATVARSQTPAMDRDTTVDVPKGPFPVKNSATGKQNTFYQNSHKSLCLQNEKGKDLWGIPFKEDLRGYVQEVDYFNNGKLQYLFAAGSKLYLIDRLGRFVGGFPVDLGKEIALGPRVYDFTGAHGYSAMVLHKDNTVGLYDLHGKPKKAWKGIRVQETVKVLPMLLETGKSRWWIVRTSKQTLLFPFAGGEPAAQGDGGKMIRPDSEIKPAGSGAVLAKCYDGKERTFKLNE